MDAQFWNHLLTTATALETHSEPDDDTLTVLLGHMESIDVLYHRNFDPAEAYKEYVAVALCRAVSKLVSETLNK